jgi:metallo-beta-lactamase class B
VTGGGPPLRLAAALAAVLAAAWLLGEIPAPDRPPAPMPTAAQTRAQIAEFDPVEQKRPPFAIFDDLYYVGIDWVSAYLIDTGDGLVLIDTAWGEYADHVLDAVRRLGFDPADVRYVLPTHGHFDHVGGAGRIQRATGARVGMTAADWEMVTEPEPLVDPLERDWVIADGESLTLGRTRLDFFVTPGHTPGVLSIRFTVHDHGTPHTALVFGGVGLNFDGVERTAAYLASVGRLRALPGIEVNLTNHPGGGRIFERAGALAARGAGDPHPFVDAAGWSAWLERLEAAALDKLTDERAALAAAQPSTG